MTTPPNSSAPAAATAPVSSSSVHPPSPSQSKAKHPESWPLTNSRAPSPPAIIPLTAFVLGSWQVQRLKWKTDLIAKCEDRLSRPPLPLPPQIDPSAVADFDYRRVLATGRFRYDREMLIGPRMRDGEAGYMVVTPLERDDGGSTVLVNRGWIAKDKGDQRARPDSLPTGEVRVEGLLREPWKKNMFTPDNRPDKGEFYFPDVEQMASLTGSQPVWIEQTMRTTTSCAA